MSRQLFFYFALLSFPLTSAWSQDFVLSEAMLDQITKQVDCRSSQELLEKYPAPQLKTSVDLDFTSENYVGIAETKLSLSSDERTMLRKQGFVVSSRISERTFVEQFIKLWRNDVPIFLSADVLLRAFHYNYVDLMRAVETELVIPDLRQLLSKMHAAIPELGRRYGGRPSMKQPLQDLDVFLCVARRLLHPTNDNLPAVFTENEPLISEIIGRIQQYRLSKIALFSDGPRPIDFSQFRPRGYYAKHPLGNENTSMSAYFRTMCWLSRCEFVIDRDPESKLGYTELSDQDVARHRTIAALMLEVLSTPECMPFYERIEDNLIFLAGQADCVNPRQLRRAIELVSGGRSGEPLSVEQISLMGEAVQNLGLPVQRVPSRIVASHTSHAPTRRPASIFNLFGKRLTIDSYIFSRVVYGAVQPEQGAAKRLFPSTQDLLFALGNNLSAELLQDELRKYGYASNLAVIRSLIDAQSPEAWRGSVYASWLDCIRHLNPPTSVEHLPAFMQTRQWWLQKMNTQLASWTQLRHDHLLYATSSYTDTFGCSYPHGYVEPLPDFYQAMHQLALKIQKKLEQIPEGRQRTLRKFLSTFKYASQKMHSIANKELHHEPLSADDKKFLDEVVIAGGYNVLRGWYINLIAPDYSGGMFATSNYERLKDYIVADYHTTPTDERGRTTGEVCHAGTGKADLAMVTVENCDGKTITFAGPVMSYYEYRTNGFERLTDEEWSRTHLREAERPAWTSSFLTTGE